MYNSWTDATDPTEISCNWWKSAATVWITFPLATEISWTVRKSVQLMCPWWKSVELMEISWTDGKSVELMQIRYNGFHQFNGFHGKQLFSRFSYISENTRIHKVSTYFQKHSCKTRFPTQNSQEIQQFTRFWESDLRFENDSKTPGF